MKINTRFNTLFLGSYSSPIGNLFVVFDEHEHIRALDFEDYEGRMMRILSIHYGDIDKGYSLTSKVLPKNLSLPLSKYFAGDVSALDSIPVATGGTEFQQIVWSSLRDIKAGSTMSYGELAKKIRRPRAIRAVGLANGANPIGIVVPCHRVIGSNGSLTGYAGGLERKKWLLNHEGAINDWQMKLL